jgi:hypothetical protein
MAMDGVTDAQKSRSRMEQLVEPKRLRFAVELIAVVVCTLAFVFTGVSISVAVLGKDTAGKRDFVEYWASAQQLVHHANPYDSDAILRIERSVSYPPDIPALVMGNTPSALPLVYPLGFVSARAGERLWFLLLLACLIGSVRMVRAMHGNPKNKLHYFGYAFAPALACLAVGQASVLILFGLVLFLKLHRSSPFLAGASLWFCALKPQLFVPFGLVLLGWVITAKCYRVLAGAASALLISTAIAYRLDPRAWTEYARMMSVSRYDKFPIPCISIMFRRSISPNTMWLQYLPAALACVWAIVYFYKHRADWDWIAHGSPLILVSVMVAPYTWLIDQTILIPALLHGVYRTSSRTTIAVLALLSAVIEIAPLCHLDLLHSSFYLWTTPGWLVWYLFASRSAGREHASDPPPIMDGLHGAGVAHLHGEVVLRGLHAPEVREV